MYITLRRYNLLFDLGVIVMFYLLAGLLLLLAVAMVWIPLWRQGRAHPHSHSDANLVVHPPTNEATNLEALRQQRREIENEFQQGVITASTRDLAIDELVQRTANEIALNDKHKQGRAFSNKKASKAPWILGVSISFFIVVGVTAGYGLRGNHAARQLASDSIVASAQPDAAVNPDAPMSDKQILAMVDNLAKKMQDNPNDARGWILLARSQHALGQFGLAVNAFERAVALNPGDAQLLADYADALAMVQEGKFDGKPRALINAALKADANNMKALALAGTADMREGNKAASLKHWLKLQSLVPKDSEDAAQVGAIINEIKTGKPAFANNQAAPQVSAPAMAEVPAPTPTDAKNNAVAISGAVDISPALRTKLSAGDTLFIFARAAGKDAPRMPLAVKRLSTPASWPVAFTLDDSMAMAPGMKLSAFADVTIEARLSKSGNAQPSSGDLQGMSAVIKPGARNLNFRIDKVLP